jgi:PTH1 family peptidyl-tRNA hydrolase
LGSTIERLGTQAFPRMRLGIGRPPGQMDPKAYVLQDFSSADQPLLQDVMNQAVQAAREFSLNGLDAAMNKFNATLS